MAHARPAGPDPDGFEDLSSNCRWLVDVQALVELLVKSWNVKISARASCTSPMVIRSCCGIKKNVTILEVLWIRTMLEMLLK